jgi:tetrapyrrole methylase family protein/MazG family protein
MPGKDRQPVITLIGLGPGNPASLSRGAEAALRAASANVASGTGALYLRTARHPIVGWLTAEGLTFETFDSLYDTAQDFAAVYEGIAARILSEAGRTEPAGFAVAYAVPGHPLFGEESVRLIRDEAAARGIETRVVPSGSFVEAVVTAAGACLPDGLDVRDALTLTASDRVDPQGRREADRIDVSRGLVLFQVYDQASASHAKLALMRDYPDDWLVAIVRWAGIPGSEEVRRVPLHLLDRETCDHLTSVYVPPLPPGLRKPSLASLAGVMARLRARDGCPWDREQTHKTLRRYLIEETYEVIEAIDEEDPELLCEELGDTLLQIVFHAQLAAEQGLFSIDDVAEGIVGKLIRRHPHVFGDVSVSGSDEVLVNWERIKRAEKPPDHARRRVSILDGVPKGLPALMAAMEISRRVVKIGFDWESLPDVLAKLDEEVAELKAEITAPAPDRDRICEEIGDLLFTLVQVTRWHDRDAEEVLREMLARFEARFRYMERTAQERQTPIEKMSAAELDALWREAKQPPALRPSPPAALPIPGEG